MLPSSYEIYILPESPAAPDSKACRAYPASDTKTQNPGGGTRRLLKSLSWFCTAVKRFL